MRKQRPTHFITSIEILKQKINLIVPVPLVFVPEAVAKKRIKIDLKLPFIFATVKIRGTGTIKLFFCFKMSMLVMK